MLNDLTRIRNEFNHCMYTVNERGEITHTNSIKMPESRGQLQLGIVRKMDDAQIKTMIEAVRNLTKLNREICDFLPLLQKHLADAPHQSGQAGPSPVETDAGGWSTD
jgi:hypothetical protein